MCIAITKLIWRDSLFHQVDFDLGLLKIILEVGFVFDSKGQFIACPIDKNTASPNWLQLHSVR